MRTQISTRRCELTEELRARAEELAAALAADQPGFTFAKYMFDESPEKRTVSAVFAVSDDDSLVGYAEASEWEAALRELEGKLRRQLEARNADAR
ncbi:MAG: HPF/RaiA family ribosome-associated protein [Gemmatimonadota bacterium]